MCLSVVLSVWEIIGQADGGLSVLRTFRLLRVLKLVRFLPALRRQLVVLMKTMDNVATFCMLLMLFIFTFRYMRAHTHTAQRTCVHMKMHRAKWWWQCFLIFYSILGMHLFGCKFSLKMENGDTIPDRKNFDSLLWAIVTVFQVRFQPDLQGWLLRAQFLLNHICLIHSILYIISIAYRSPKLGLFELADTYTAKL